LICWLAIFVFWVYLEKNKGLSQLLAYMQAENDFIQNSSDLSASFFMYLMVLTELRLKLVDQVQEVM